MELTKEFVKSCRSAGLLRDFLLQAMDQVDNLEKENLCPNGEGFGDYMIMDIDENGQIQNWKKKDLENWVEKATAKE